MHSLKSNGDSIAAEFAKLVRKSKTLAPKIAQDLAEDSPAEGEACDSSVNNADDQEALRKEIEGAIITDEAGASTDLAEDALSEGIDSLKAYSREDYILAGLSKIASNLRGKGEGFAADVVLATAKDISDDFKKEAGRKNHIVSSLNKIATELQDKGDRFASDLVKATINKIRQINICSY